MMSAPAMQFGTPGANSQRRLTTFQPYYSRVRFTTTVSTTPFVYTIQAGQSVVGFGYQLNQDMAAGGRAGTVAKRSDTNIIQASRTVSGDNLRITGVSLQILSTSLSGEMIGGIWPEISALLQFSGGNNQYWLGTPMMLPGASGLYGSAQNITGVQPIAGGRPFFGFVTNGLPGIMNQQPFPEGVTWRDQDQDSALNVILNTERAFATNLSGATASDKVTEAPAAGIRGYTYPAAADVFVDVLIWLHGVIEGPRSDVS